MSLSENATNTTNSTLSLHSNRKNVQITCPGNSKVFQLCINDKCSSKDSFTCGDDDCKCQTEHELCMKANLTAVLKVVEKKIHKTDQIKAYVTETFNKIVDQISIFQQKLLQDIEKDIKYTQLVEVQRKLLSIVYQTEKNLTPFNPKDSALLWKIVNHKGQEVSAVFEKTKQLLKKMQEESKKSIEKVEANLTQTIREESQKRHISMFQNGGIQINTQVNHQLTNQQKALVEELNKKSAICKQGVLSQRLVRFFTKPLKSAKLLFRASEHGFKIAKFFEICGLMTNTVIICRSDKGKVVGCYTPFSCYRENIASDMWVADPSRESFLFSLSNNDKFVLSKKNNALFIYKDKRSIYFGNAQIYIRDDSNTNTNSYLKCNEYYINEKYTAGDKQSYLSFNGNQTLDCIISEWEVFQLQFH